jgi:hypothetical protein
MLKLFGYFAPRRSMGWKVTLDLSLNKDKGSLLRNAINNKMGKSNRKGIATREIQSNDIEELAAKLVKILSYLADPTMDEVKASEDAKLDHLWLYIEKTDEEEASNIRFTMLNSDSSEPETDGEGISASIEVSDETEN